MGILKTQSQIARLESEILDNYGEISDEQSELLTQLNNQIEADRDNAFRFLQSKRPKEIKEQIKTRIDDMKKEIEKLERIEGAIENALNRFLQDKDYWEVKDEAGNTEFYVKKDMKIRRSVNSELIPEDLITEKIEFTLTKAESENFRELLKENGYTDYKLDTVYPTVTQLPEEHPAIVKHITPKIKFVKNKPKV